MFTYAYIYKFKYLYRVNSISVSWYACVRVCGCKTYVLLSAAAKIDSAILAAAIREKAAKERKLPRGEVRVLYIVRCI